MATLIDDKILQAKKTDQYLPEKFDLIAQEDGSVSAIIDTLFIGCSDAAQNIKQIIPLAATSLCPLLITGPSGSGKEVAAKAIHAISPRRRKPLISINCGAIPHELIEAELFGHSKGSFTGAHKDHIGLFEQANGGTLFLDEIGEMPLNLQVRLLRVIEDGIIRSIGGQEKPTDVRIIAATNVEMGHSIGKGEFREDLYYRLSVLSLDIPTLSARRDDIKILAEHFIKNMAATGAIRLDAAAWDILKNHDWPGNVRELRNWVARAGLFDKDQIINGHRAQTLINMGLPRYNAAQYPVSAPIYGQNLDDNIIIPKDKEPFDLRHHLLSQESQYMQKALHKANGNVAKAARNLCMKRTTFIEKMKRFSL